MFAATRTTRSRESSHLIVAASIASILILLTAACSGGSDSKNTLVAEVKAAEVPSSTSQTTTPVANTTPARPSVSPTVTYGEAESVFNGKRYSEATEMFAVIAARTPSNAFAHYMLGLSAWKAGDRERAEKAFLVALDRDSNHVKAHLNLARVLLEGGRKGEALPHIEKALVVDPVSVDGYRLMGRVRGEMKEVEPSIDAYRKAISLSEKDSWSMNNLGFVLIQNGRYDEALGPLARATELTPNVAVFFNNLGMALERTFRYTQAVEAYRVAVSLDSSSKAAGSLKRLEGRKDEAWVTPVDLKVLAKTFADGVKGR